MEIRKNIKYIINLNTNVTINVCNETEQKLFLLFLNRLNIKRDLNFLDQPFRKQIVKVEKSFELDLMYFFEEKTDKSVTRRK